MKAQLKTFHFWFMLVMALIDGVVGTQGLLSAKALHALVAVQGLLLIVNHQLAAFWAPPADAKMPLPPGSSLRAMLPLAFLALTLSGCATAGGKALGACELGQLPSEGQIGFATAQQIASNPNSTTADLESAALQLLPGQLECGAKALLAWLESLGQPAAPSTKGKMSPRALLVASSNDHAIQVLKQYLAAHPAACGVRQAM
jgi:hypothetical protein